VCTIFHFPIHSILDYLIHNTNHTSYNEKWSKEVVTKKWKIGVVENYVEESRKQKEIKQPKKKKKKTKNI
jgi:hypothetical protein